jgi:FtsZ-interacting cell division protein ZipA
VTLTSILILVVIIWIVKLILSRTNSWKNSISLSWKERIKAKQIKKELKEKKENIINPNTEDTSTNEEFQEVIETAVAEKNEEDKSNAENTEEKKDTDKKETAKKQKENIDEENKEEEQESSVFDETTSLDTPSEKVLDEKEKKMIERISIEATSLKNE